MPSVKLLIEDLERMQERITEAAAHGVPAIPVEPYSAELYGRAAVALKEQRREIMDEIAGILRERWETNAP